MKNMMDTLQEKVSRGSVTLLAAPYLPNGLIWAALLIAYTDWIIMLLAQPAAYWIDRHRAASALPFLQNLLATGVWVYLLIGLVYLIIFWVVLTILTRTCALVIWLTISFVHLSHAIAWLVIITHVADRTTATTGLGIVVGTVSTLILGIVLAMVLLRKAVVSTRPTAWKRWLQPVALGTWIISLLTIVSISAIAPRGGWMQMHPKHTPGRRANSAVAYDSTRHRIVLFGGISEWIGSSFYYEQDTWEWDGQDWIQMHPKTNPSPRAGQMMAYDQKHGVVVLFGGEEKSGTFMFSDTWIWDGKDWTLMSPTIYPTGRRGGQLFYDPETEKVILTGGFYYAPGKVFTAVSDTWAWNGEDWEYLAALPGNLMITNPNVAFSPTLKNTALFDYKQLLSWSNNQWQVLDVGTMPPSRFGTWLAADPKGGKMLIFGGVDNNVQRNDTWVFDGKAWKELHPALTPSPRDAYVMFYDPTRKSFILYGGISTYTLNDMWEYALP